MKFFKLSFLVVIMNLGVVSASWAADHIYQVTGPVLSFTDKSIVVQKGTEKWEVTRDGSSQIKGDLKVGSKVTIVYHMVADTVTVK